jgi:two-component system, NtrC family, response regulator
MHRSKVRHISPAHFQEMVGTCPAMLQVFQLIRKVAATDFPVCITGPSGTGKEMVAQALHQRSLRAKGPFVVVNCGAIPRDLLESELFGHERGAFTGAYRTVVGKVELAHKGTLFLDEVGELPLELQVKLLRFLQDYSFERIGGREKQQVDIRVVSATNANLKELISQGRFREDLYYRMSGINIELPPLKDRGPDLLIMANLFLRRFAYDLEKEITGYTDEALHSLQNYGWPGNIRELINHVRRAVVMTEGSQITVKNLGIEDSLPANELCAGLGLRESLSNFEAQLVSEALSKAQGNVQLAAKKLKTSRSVIYNLIKKHNLNEKAG